MDDVSIGRMCIEKLVHGGVSPEDLEKLFADQDALRVVIETCHLLRHKIDTSIQPTLGSLKLDCMVVFGKVFIHPKWISFNPCFGCNLFRAFEMFVHRKPLGLDAMYLLLRNQHLIPEELKGQRIFFLGTRLSAGDDAIFPYMSYTNDKWSPNSYKARNELEPMDLVALYTGPELK